ncbi:MAG: hypothetical protein JWQ84_3579 [Mucilaginibacter sp.]|jgi:PAS domain S-box-containing protein|nr:hypothetical protein [Mucilaginibacter sp.]MDB5018747.1 hypothetical protein [Mucilaginibacter sp.]MDB5140154.1 hypothetical protein [Mucilaginibacter sp.]
MVDTDIESIKAVMQGTSIYYMICVALDSTFSYVNPHYAKSFQFIDENLVGKPYYVTMHPDDTKVCEEVGAKCFEYPDRSFPAIIRKHNGKGSYLITLWDYRLIVKNGNPEGIFCIGHDITEFEAQKKDLQQLNENLDKTFQKLEKVAYDQSHVVRLPLANILGLVSLLKTGEMDQNMSHIISMIEESSVKLDNAIRDIVKSTY